jgi:hypothetical protein
MRRARSIGLALGIAAYVVACGNIIGIPDRYYAPGDDASSDGTTGPEGAGDDRGGSDGPTTGDQTGSDHVGSDVQSSSSSGGDGSIGDAPSLQYDACPYCDDGGLCVLACNQDHPNSIAVDTNNVYWTNRGDGASGGTIWQSDKSGLAPAEVASAPNPPAGITTDVNGCIYWIEYGGGNVIRGYCTGSTSSLLSNAAASYFAISGNLMVWATSGGGSDSVNKCSLPACTNSTPITLNRTSPFALAIDGPGGIVYWLEQSGGNGTVLSCPVAGCTTPSTVAVTPGPAQSLAVVSQSAVVWTSGTPGLDDGEVSYLPFVVGQTALQASHRSAPTGVATDGTSVYWVEQGAGSTGVVYGCDLSIGGDCSSTLRAYAGGLTFPVAVAVDSTRIYWVNEGLTGVPGSVIPGTVMSALR